MAQEKAKGLLDSFSLNDDEDWSFGPTSETKDDEATVIKKIKDEEEDEEIVDESDKTKEKKETKKKEVKNEEIDDDGFGSFEDENENEEKGEGKDTKTKVKTSTPKDKGKDENKEDENEGEEPEDKDDFTDYAKDLKDRGIFGNIEIPKDAKIKGEEIYELMDKEVESRVDETLEALFEEVGEEGKDFIKFIKNGGKPNVYLSQVGNGFNLDELDTENTNQVNKTVKYYLSTYEKLDEDEIEDRVKWLTDNGKIKGYSTKYFNTIKKDEKERKELLLETQKNIADSKIERVKKFNEALRNDLNKVETVGTFTISKAEQKELDTFFTKPTVKVGKNRYVPEFHAELSRILEGKTKEDRKQLILLGKLFKDKFELPEIEEKVTTKVTSAVKSRLNTGRGIKRASTGIYGSKKSLADFVDI